MQSNFRGMKDRRSLLVIMGSLYACCLTRALNHMHYTELHFISTVVTEEHLKKRNQSDVSKQRNKNVTDTCRELNVLQSRINLVRNNSDYLLVDSPQYS
jgi:hypothetical protein